jgi:Tfp pilus assembly protein PilV
MQQEKRGDAMMSRRDISRAARTRPRTHYRGGFSLVEVMAASIVLLVGVIGAFAYFTYGRTALNIDAHRRVALEVATSRMETIRSCDCANIASYEETDEPVQIEGNYGYRTTHIDSIDEDGDSTTDYYNVTVTVAWTENARNMSVQLITTRSSLR